MLLAQQQKAKIDADQRAKVDAYDSKVDDAPTASAIFMAKLSPMVLLTGMKLVHRMIQISYLSNVILDNPYMDSNEEEVVQEMTSLAQNDVSILSLIKNMQHKVTRCNTVNLESKQVNEQLTNRLGYGNKGLEDCKWTRNDKVDANQY
uniref:Uncharacterized protein n=1 Tax=Tanacetum cinerariifolium TaxID=118510 RepID=A0A699I0Z9_TANCI|nr:hypothetical protein [Tanacetum cinerariifolium]